MTKRQDVMWGVNDSTNIPSEQYDPLNRPVEWENTGGGDNPFARSWQQYDSLGRMTATWRDEQSGKGEKFWFTADNQLSVVEYNADQVWTGNPQNWNRWVGYTYTADTLNRSSVNDNGNFTNYYGVSLINQYTNINGAGPGYDSNFNLTGFNGFGTTYNSANQLTSASNNGSNGQFIYDGLGRCVKRTVNGATTVIAYDDWKPTVEWDGNGNFQAWNVYGSGPDEILWRCQAGVDHLRYHHDSRGNVAFVLGGGGQGYERYTYDAFGQPTITDWDGNVRSQSAIGNRFMFQGREWINELGIYDFRNRYYHPQLGRFLQKDPTGFAAGDANLFRYCGGDPVKGRDPYGLEQPHTSKPPPQKRKDGNDGNSSSTASASYTPTGTNIPLTIEQAQAMGYGTTLNGFSNYIRDNVPLGFSSSASFGDLARNAFFNAELNSLGMSLATPGVSVTGGTMEQRQQALASVQAVFSTPRGGEMQAQMQSRGFGVTITVIAKG